jgi:hypothetical protein
MSNCAVVGRRDVVADEMVLVAEGLLYEARLQTEASTGMMMRPRIIARARVSQNFVV